MGNIRSRSPFREILVNTLQLLALVGFSIAQPVFTLLADNGEFFVVRKTLPLDILTFAFLALALPTLIFVVIELCFSLLGSLARRAAHVSLVILLAALGMLPILGRLDFLPAATVILGSLTLGMVFGWCHVRFQALRSFLTYVSAATIIFPLTFIFTSDIRDIVIPGASDDTDFVQSEGNNISVVLIVFDEFATTSLMTKKHFIDEELFPNFSWLSDRSHWFRNASTVATGTVDAVPAIFSGRYALDRQPTLRDYPDNIFTLLGSPYTYNVHESASRLCPPKLCPNHIQAGFSQRITSLLADVAIVYSHIVTPDGYARFLPDISQGWDNFLGTADGDAAGEFFSGGWLNFVKSNFKDDREAVWRNFITAIPASGPSLNVLHSLLPHLPLQYFPSGRTYARLPLAGLENDKWSDDKWAVKQAWQRHLMQAAYADKLLGQVFAELIRKNQFDDSLVVVVADHGVSFKNGDFRRQVSSENFMDILPVPLFIKLPGQKHATVSDENVETVDILPTILDVLELKNMPSMDGFSVFESERRPSRKHKRLFDHKLKKTNQYPPVLEEMYESVDKRLALFSNAATSNRLFAMGPDRKLVGQNISELPRAPDERPLLLVGSELIPGANLITGSIGNLQPRAPALHLALSVNGFIVSVTKTFSPDVAGFRDFIFLVSESASVDTGSEMSIWVKNPMGWRALQRVAYSIIAENGEPAVIRSSEGDQFTISSDAVEGYVGELVAENGSIRVSGWAIDVGNTKPVEMVLLFNGGEFVAAAPPTIQRPGVVTKYESSSYLRSGFDISGPDKSQALIPGDIEVFGLTGDRSAVKLIHGVHRQPQ